MSLTVILPAHNAEPTIAAAIASTLSQTYADFELWVLENGSTDRTAQIARSFNDRRVKVFELGPIGFQSALQFGIENASSEWLARIDADDLMFPNRLRIQIDHGVVELVCARFVTVILASPQVRQLRKPRSSASTCDT